MEAIDYDPIFTYVDVLKAKIERLSLLTKLRKEQHKCYKWVTCIDLDSNRTQELNEKSSKFGSISKELESQINKIPSLWSSFGYTCTDKKGNLIQTYDIQLNNNMSDLKNKLKKELK